MTDSSIARKNQNLAWKLLLVAVAMFGFAYVMADTFTQFCELVGIKRVKDVQVNRVVNVEFITSLGKSAPLAFWVEKEKQKLTVNPGSYYTVNFYVENKTDKTLTTQAIADFSPKPTRLFFEKTECFCFTVQILKPHEVKKMPMRFTVKQDLPVEYKTITLAYTFFDNTEQQ
jgi:cytochrome c oxidase assembly protein subunit 11